MNTEGERVHVDYKQDNLPLAAGLYEAFLAKGRAGRYALAVYLHLLYTYRRQGTNRPWATNEYLQRGLGVGRRCIKKARALLVNMGLTEYIRERGVKGRMGKVYTKLNLVPGGQYQEPGQASTTGSETAPMVTTGSFYHPVAATDKCFKKKLNAYKSAEPTAPPAIELPKSKKATKGRSEHSTLTALFFEKYLARLGHKPPWTKKEGQLLKTDLVRLGPEVLGRLLVRFFDDPLPDVRRFAERAGWGYNVFHSQLAALEADQRAQEDRLALVRVCPHCGKTQDHDGGDCLYCSQPLKGARHVV